MLARKELAGKSSLADSSKARDIFLSGAFGETLGNMLESHIGKVMAME